MLRFKRKFFVPSLLAFLLFVLFILQPKFLSKTQTTLIDILKFPLKLTGGILKEFKTVLTFHKIYRENIALKKEVGLLNQKIVELQEASKENERLQRLLSFKTNTTFSTEAARVIGRDSTNWVSSIIIDKGKRSNVEVGMPVISEIGLVGKVFEVGNSISKILLINDPNFKVAAIVQDSRDEGIVSGSLGGNCRMYFLSLESDVEVNDIVVTSGLGGVFPKGLLIGRVIDVDVDPGGLMKNCSIQPSTDLSNIEEVLVIVK